jgi:GNAT superfamily N-acetyltransferase
MFKIFSTLLLPVLATTLSFASEQKEESVPQERQLVLTRSLNPFKGETVWIEPNKEVTFSWPSYGTWTKKTVTATLPGEFEITLSPHGLELSDYGKVLAFLEQYNRSKLKFPEKSWSMSLDLPSTLENLTPQHISFLHFLQGETKEEKVSIFSLLKNLKVLIRGHAVWIEEALPLIQEKSFQNMPGLLNAIESDVTQKGATRAFILCNDTKNDSEASLFESLGYRFVASDTDLKKGKHGFLMTKELTPSASTALKFTWKETSDSTDQQYEAFKKEAAEGCGVFVRDSLGHVVGGTVATINEKAVTPHAYIELFCNSDVIRGTGFGYKIMEYVEKYFKSRGINLIELGTLEVQAPEFYKKIGYKEVFHIPDMVKTLEGKPVKSYTFRKKI